jgi:serine/threonine protein kinase
MIRNVEVPVELVDVGYTNIGVPMQSAHSIYLDFEEIIVNELIGDGAFAKVFSGYWRGTPVAVKVFKDQNIHEDANKDFNREIDTMNKLRHPNIVNFIGAVTTDGKRCLVTEFMEMGSLQGLIENRMNELSLLLKLKIALDAAKGMDFLHQSNILHRDLKPDNLLISTLSPDAQTIAKLSDFGTSRSQNHNKKYTQSIGTPCYMSPVSIRMKTLFTKE